MKDSQVPVDHPETPAERTRLNRTLNYIRAELDEIDSFNPLYGLKRELSASATYQSGKKSTLLRALTIGPYYGRFDYREDKFSEIEEFYITKIEHLGMQHGPVQIIYWASPLGGLFNQNQRAHVAYLSPEGPHSGEVFLRRHIVIQDTEITQVIDEFDSRPRPDVDDIADISPSPTVIEKPKSRPKRTIAKNEIAAPRGFVDPDAFLKSVLEGKHSPGLREVVATIQQKQNDIIRSPYDVVLLVQGPAGSGKTTIALHRVAILLYAFKQFEKLSSPKILVVGPNQLFLRFVEDVLPSLEIQGVEQRTFLDLMIRETRGTDTNQTIRTNSFQKSTKQAGNSIIRNRRAQFIGSLKMAPILENAVESAMSELWEKGFLLFPTGTGSLGHFYTVSREQATLKHEDASWLTAEVRRKRQIERLTSLVMEEHVAKYDGWISSILTDMDKENISAALREEREQQLSHYRRIQPQNYADTRREEGKQSTLLETLRKEVRSLVDAELRPISPMDVWLRVIRDPAFLTSVIKKTTPSKSLAGNTTVCKTYYAQHVDEIVKQISISGEFNEMTFSMEDLPALAYLHFLIYGMNIKYDHIIVDEVQDMPPLALYLLNRLINSSRLPGGMTLLGDIAQSIHAATEIQTWNDIKTVFAPQTVAFEQLDVAYRSTHEITTYANKILKRGELRQSKLPTAAPFARHGAAVKLLQENTESAHLDLVHIEVTRLWKSDVGTIAVICRVAKQCRAVERRLQESGIKCDLITQGNVATRASRARIEGLLRSSERSVIILPVEDAKGIEFDAVVVAYANEANYPPDTLSGKLFYVAVSRPLHELILCWYGKPSIYAVGDKVFTRLGSRNPK